MIKLCTGVDNVKVQTGYLYHIKDEFFDRINNKGLMINHENGHSRPSYLAIKDDDILWFIPLSTKIEKYKTIIDKKEKKYGTCKTILIKKNSWTRTSNFNSKYFSDIRKIYSK